MSKASTVSMDRSEIDAMSETRLMLSTVEVARRLGVSLDTVRRLIAYGHLAAVNVGTRTRPRWRVSVADLDAFKQRRETARPPATPRRQARRAAPIRRWVR